MRFYEFCPRPLVESSEMISKIITVLNNISGEYENQKDPITINWATLANRAKNIGLEMLSSPTHFYIVFKHLWDEDQQARQALESLISDFNSRYIQLANPSQEEPESDGESSEEKIDQIAASAAPQQLAKDRQTPKV